MQRQYRLIAFLLISLACRSAGAQQLWLYDNTNYKAIYFKEACDLIARTPDLVLLDVRSPGEYADTTRFVASRIGRLKGAINVSVDSVRQHYNDLLPYKDRTILVYCSHSFRSRRVSKLLADSGFSKVYSLNGGMTEVDRAPVSAFPCKPSIYTSALPYKLMGPEDAAAFVRDKDHVVIDVRAPSQFNGRDSMPALNLGRFRTAINIPVAEVDRSLPRLEKYKDKAILLCSLDVSESMIAASKLKAAGFGDVSVLFGGLDEFLFHFSSASKVRRELITAEPPYHITGVQEAVTLVKNTPDLVVADMRPAAQFGNKAKPAFYNIGHITNAVNFATASDLVDYLKNKPKNTPVLVYRANSAASGQMSDPADVDVAGLCKKLAGKGYTNIHLLYDGLFSVVWASANVDGEQDAKDILTDHQGLY